MLNFHGWDVTSLFLLCDIVRDAWVHETTLLHFLMNEYVIDLLKKRENFTRGYRIIGIFNLKELNFKTSQTRVSNFQNVSIIGIPLGFAVKSCQNSQNTPLVF